MMRSVPGLDGTSQETNTRLSTPCRSCRLTSGDERINRTAMKRRPNTTREIRHITSNGTQRGVLIMKRTSTNNKSELIVGSCLGRKTPEVCSWAATKKERVENRHHLPRGDDVLHCLTDGKRRRILLVKMMRICAAKTS